MSAVIALSGVHFCHKISNPDMLYTTWAYYAQAVRGLKHELTRINCDESSVVRLLFVTILLCHVEVCESSGFQITYTHDQVLITGSAFLEILMGPFFTTYEQAVNLSYHL